MLSSSDVPMRLSFVNVPKNTANVFFLLSVNRWGLFLR
jgi:hypothetical protein